MSKLHLSAGSAADGPYAVAITPESAGWTYTGLRVLELPAGGTHTFDTGEEEVLVLPLAGSCSVECAGVRFDLAGREHVFAGPTDFAYVPIGTTATVRSADGGRFALPTTRATRELPPRYGAAADVPVEIRGAGQCTRQINNFCTPESFDTDRIIAVEVYTPAGNWSSYPPHKHDEDRPGEAVLEEVYYYEISPAPPGTGPGIGYQRVYGSSDVLAEVRQGDVVLIPHGWHGPAIAVPGYDLYYLNVMAGPGAVRAWLITIDPAHAWIRETWADQPTDPRLPIPVDHALIQEDPR